MESQAKATFEQLENTIEQTFSLVLLGALPGSQRLAAAEGRRRD